MFNLSDKLVSLLQTFFDEKSYEYAIEMLLNPLDAK